MPEKGTRKSKSCRHLDYSKLNLPLPCLDCKLGYQAGGFCKFRNDCPDYKYSWMITREQVKENLKLAEEVNNG